MDILTATKDFEQWVGRRTAVVKSQFSDKHKQMAASPVQFLRGTFYRWTQLFPEICPEMRKAPAVLSVGDLHIASFGTWRDGFGRLIWGIDDFDEAYPLPYANDLVRLAVSAILDASEGEIKVGLGNVVDVILDGYRTCLRAGGLPFVLEEKHKWLRDEIAQSIASALHVKLAATPAPYKPSLPAYEALLKARYYFGTFRPDLLALAKECYEQAIALDPKFAQAHCEYGNYFWGLALAGALPANQALPMIRSLAEKALELDPSLPDGHAMSGIVAVYLEYDWKEAERRFRLAIARDPISVNVRLYYTWCLQLVGRPAEAVQQIILGMQADPLNLTLRQNRAVFLAGAGRDEEAAERFREVLELNPSMVLAQLALAALHASRGELGQALALCEKAYAVAPLPSGIGLLAGLLKRTGNMQRAEELIEKLRPADAFGVPRGLAIYHWVLQEFDAEADWLEKTIDQHDPYGALFLRLWYGRSYAPVRAGQG